MDFKAGLELIHRAIGEMQTRFVMGHNSFVIKAITKDGIQIIQDVQKPKGAF